MRIQSGIGVVDSSANSVSGTHATTRAFHWSSGPKSSTYSDPSDGVPAERNVHHWSRPLGVATAANTSHAGAAMGKS